MECHIARGGLVRIEDREGALISVLDGALWITQERDARDYYVKAGERFRVERGGLVLASALRASRIALTYDIPHIGVRARGQSPGTVPDLARICRPS
jgi:hypothetical protein